MGVGLVSDNAGERGFSGTGRAPEDKRVESFVSQHAIQDFAGPEQLGLADKLVKAGRAHALRQRGMALQGFFGAFFKRIELLHGRCLYSPR